MRLILQFHNKQVWAESPGKTVWRNYVWLLCDQNNALWLAEATGKHPIWNYHISIWLHVESDTVHLAFIFAFYTVRRFVMSSSSSRVTRLSMKRSRRRQRKRSCSPLPAATGRKYENFINDTVYCPWPFSAFLLILFRLQNMVFSTPLHRNYV